MEHEAYLPVLILYYLVPVTYVFTSHFIQIFLEKLSLAFEHVIIQVICEMDSHGLSSTTVCKRLREFKVNCV